MRQDLANWFHSLTPAKARVLLWALLGLLTLFAVYFPKLGVLAVALAGFLRSPLSVGILGPIPTDEKEP